ncbi:MAG TPA: P1 family peptidase [Longimicrobiales bacterium]|nr:P1 family peptidase [Longimicrobiales bacterium]
MRNATVAVLLLLLSAGPLVSQTRPRARDAGVVVGILPTGPANAITDVEGVRVGHATVVEGDSVRTGVTAVLPHGGNLFREKVPAAIHVGNGFGKLAGVTQVRELGEIETPILLTCTLCVWRAADAMVEWLLARPGMEGVRSINPVVGETNDGTLNDIRARPIRTEHVVAALESAAGGPGEEGSVGAGAGTVAFGWKGGIGTSSRVLPEALGGWTVGVLVQSNSGGVLTINGAPVGRERRVGRHDDHDRARAVVARAGLGIGSLDLIRERVATELHTDRRAGHLEDSAEVRLHEHADRPAAEAFGEHAAARADPSLPTERDGSGSRADGPFLDGPAGGGLQGGHDVLRLDGACAYVVQRAVVGLPHHRVDRAHVLHPVPREHPRDERIGRPPDAQRAGEQNGRLELSELPDLRDPEELAEAIADVHRRGHAGAERVAPVRNDGGHARAHPRRLDDGCMADLDTRDVGDRVVLARREDADDDADVARPRSLDVLRPDLAGQRGGQGDRDGDAE